MMAAWLGAFAPAHLLAGRTALPEAQLSKRSISSKTSGSLPPEARPSGMGISLHLISSFCFFVLFCAALKITKMLGWHFLPGRREPPFVRRQFATQAMRIQPAAQRGPRRAPDY
jgi:hypothetical protein